MKHRCFLTLFFVTFVYFFSWNKVIATDFYVSPSGNNSNPGTLAQPFKTIKDNVWRLYPGDTMYLRGGTYTGEQFNPIRSGEPNKPITLKAYNGETPVLANIPGPTQAMYFYNLKYITVDGVDIDTVDGHWVSIWLSSYITIKNCNFSNVTRNIIGFYIIHSNHITVKDCVMDKVSDPLVTQDKDLIYVENTDFSLFENLTLTRGPHTLIGLQNSTYNVIRNNILRNEWQKNLGLGAPVRTELGHNVIENNKIFGSRPAVLEGYQGKGAMGIYVNQKANIIRRNQIYDNSNFGILMDGNNALGNSSVTNNKIYNNVIFQNGKAKGYSNGGGLIVTDFLNTINMGNNTFKNNIIANNTGYNIYLSSQQKQFDGNTYSGNCIASDFNAPNPIKVEGIGENSLAWFQTNYPTSIFANIESPTSFVSSVISAPDFHLQSQSNCIDKGVRLTSTIGSGSSQVIPVVDASFFTDGFGIIEGDIITIGPHTSLNIIDVDYSTNTITVDRSISWSANMSVSEPYQGTAPDAGVFEYNGTSVIPTSPTIPTITPTPTQPTFSAPVTISNFQLIRTDNGQAIQTLNTTQPTTVNLASMPSYTIEALTNSSTQSVKWSRIADYNSTPIVTIDNSSRFTIVCDGIGWFCPWDVGVGTYTITATPYSQQNAQGMQGTTTTFTIQVINQATVQGDANGDGKVDGIDYVVWLTHYNQTISGPNNGDFNNSGKVDGLDYVIWLNNYRQ